MRVSKYVNMEIIGATCWLWVQILGGWSSSEKMLFFEALTFCKSPAILIQYLLTVGKIRWILLTSFTSRKPAPIFIWFSESERHFDFKDKLIDTQLNYFLLEQRWMTTSSIIFSKPILGRISIDSWMNDLYSETNAHELMDFLYWNLMKLHQLKHGF